jgi:hypothetical protein
MIKEFPQGKTSEVFKGTLKKSNIPVKITFQKLEDAEVFLDFYVAFKRDLYWDFVGLMNLQIAEKKYGGIVKSERFLREIIKVMSYYLYTKIEAANFKKLTEPIKSFLKKSGLDGSEDKLYRETFFVASLINYVFSGWLEKNLISFASIKERNSATNKIIKKTPIYSGKKLMEGFEPKSFKKIWINPGKELIKNIQVKNSLEGLLLTIKKTEPEKTSFVLYLLKTIPNS